MTLKPWIEAMRLRTLPVSIAGVVAACGYAVLYECFKWLPAILCLLFAVMAQIVSNFANEYYDFKNGLDRKGREGPRRGVTEGDISPEAMKGATYGVLALACAIGCSLIYWGGWWLLAAGILIALGAIAYSAGPFPLSHHALGEVAVVFFFGIIPVNLTFYIQSGYFDTLVTMASVGIGLMGANILLVNNYRDRYDDAAVGKNTIAVVFGGRPSMMLYLINGIMAVVLTGGLWVVLMINDTALWGLVPVGYLILHVILWHTVLLREGSKLNPMLGMTAMLMLLYAISLLLGCIAEA